MLTTFGLVKLILLLIIGAAAGAGVAVMMSVGNTSFGNDRQRRILWGAIVIGVLADRLLFDTHGLSITQVIVQNGAMLAANYAGYRLMESYILTARGGGGERRL